MARTLKKIKKIRRKSRKQSRVSPARKKKTIKKKQKHKQEGGSILAIVGGLTALAATAATAFASYKYSGLIKERNKVDLLIGQVGNIEYLPKLSITRDKESIRKYLKCISNSEFIEFLREIIMGRRLRLGQFSAFYIAGEIRRNFWWNPETCFFIYQ